MFQIESALGGMSSNPKAKKLPIGRALPAATPISGLLAECGELGPYQSALATSTFVEFLASAPARVKNGAEQLVPLTVRPTIGTASKWRAWTKSEVRQKRRKPTAKPSPRPLPG
jgi:hypothetical protein